MPKHFFGFSYYVVPCKDRFCLEKTNWYIRLSNFKKVAEILYDFE